MNMQHDERELRDAEPISIRPFAEFKSEKARSETLLSISQLSMASIRTIERITREYPHLKAAWICLRVESNHESVVEKVLLEAGVDALVVRQAPYKTVRRRRVVTISGRPVIGGYVFVRCIPMASALAGLLGVDGVRDVVGTALTPWRARDEDMERFKQLGEEGEYDRPFDGKIDFMVGEQVRVGDGPFASFPGIVTAIDAERFRISVEVDIFGRATPVEMEIAQLEKI